MTFSLTLGLAIAIVAAYLLDRLDDVIHSPEEAERLSGLATLGIIPNIREPGRIESELADPQSALAEAYRSLCASLQFSTGTGLPKSLFVTSSGPGEGKSITALAIAKHFSVMGLKVLIIDADLRNASLHKKLGLENVMGLSKYLVGCPPGNLIQRTEIDNLFFMGSGPVPASSAHLLNGLRLKSLIALSLDVFDLIVIDGPPVLGLADAPILSNVVAATVFVISAGQSRARAVRNALKRLEILRTTVIGAIINNIDPETAGAEYKYVFGYVYNNGEKSNASNHQIGKAFEKGRNRLKKVLGGFS